MRAKQVQSKADKECVLTIAMLGTGEHRKDKTLLTQLIDSIQTSSTQYKHLIDGIGGGSGRKDSGNKQTAVENPCLGSYTFKCQMEHDALTVHKERRERNLVGKFIHKVKGLVYGKGHNEAIAEVLEVVETLFHAGKKPITLNLAGFSRGGDTMIRAINELSTRYTREEVIVNLFAIDPVPGAGRHKNATRAHFVPDIVNEMQVILMQDDHRATFQPLAKADLTIEDPSKTKVSYHIYNGTHSSPNYLYDPRNKDATQSSTQDPARLANAAITSFAIDHKIAIARVAKTTGYLKSPQYRRETVIPQGNLNAEKQLSNYTGMALRKPEYTNIVSGSHNREFTKYHSDYVLHGVTNNDVKSMHQESYFLDRQHLHLFQAEYPRVFDYFFQRNREHRSTWAALKEELAKISDDPDLRQSLENHFGFDLTQKVVPPCGISLVAKSFYEHSKLGQVWEGIQSIRHASPQGDKNQRYQAQAQGLYQEAYKILVGPGEQQYKEERLIKLLEASLEHAANPPLLNYRLNHLLQQAGEPHDMGTELIDYLIDKLEGSKLSAPLILQLQYAKRSDATIDTQSIKTMLKTALQEASAEYRNEIPPNADRRAYVKLLRQCLTESSVGTINSPVCTKDKRAQLAQQEEIKKLLKGLGNPDPDPAPASTPNLERDRQKPRTR